MRTISCAALAFVVLFWRGGVLAQTPYMWNGHSDLTNDFASAHPANAWCAVLAPDDNHIILNGGEYAADCTGSINPATSVNYAFAWGRSEVLEPGPYRCDIENPSKRSRIAVDSGNSLVFALESYQPANSVDRELHLLRYAYGVTGFPDPIPDGCDFGNADFYSETGICLSIAESGRDLFPVAMGVAPNGLIWLFGAGQSASAWDELVWARVDPNDCSSIQGSANVPIVGDHNQFEDGAIAFDQQSNPYVALWYETAEGPGDYYLQKIGVVPWSRHVGRLGDYGEPLKDAPMACAIANGALYVAGRSGNAAIWTVAVDCSSGQDEAGWTGGKLAYGTSMQDVDQVYILTLPPNEEGAQDILVAGSSTIVRYTPGGTEVWRKDVTSSDKISGLALVDTSLFEIAAVTSNGLYYLSQYNNDNPTVARWSKTLALNSAASQDLRPSLAISPSGRAYVGGHAVRSSEDVFGVWMVCGLVGDFNLDNIVNMADLGIIAQNYGNAGSFQQGDANFDGIIDFSDWALFLSVYGHHCP